MKLSKLVKFIPGLNPSRLDEKIIDNTTFYDKESFDNDLLLNDGESLKLKNNEFSLSTGDLILYSITNQVAIVGKSNEGKIPSLNFSKIELFSDKLDKNYFFYMFNENEIIQKQKERDRQGLHILKLPLRSLYNIEIPMIPIEEQRKIGMIYVECIKLKSRIEEYSNLLDQASMQLLSMKVRDEYDNWKNTKKRTRI